MNGHVTHDDPERGFTLVELLITIVLAGIVFAAMVPVFVQALQRNSADTYRQLAVSIAREKIQKIRQLADEQIQANRPRLNQYAQSCHNGQRQAQPLCS